MSFFPRAGKACSFQWAENNLRAPLLPRGKWWPRAPMPKSLPQARQTHNSITHLAPAKPPATWGSTVPNQLSALPFAPPAIRKSPLPESLQHNTAEERSEDLFADTILDDRVHFHPAAEQTPVCPLSGTSYSVSQDG